MQKTENLEPKLQTLIKVEDETNQKRRRLSANS